MPVFASTNSMQLRMIEELTYGDTPVTPTMTNLSVLSQGLTAALRGISPETIRLDRMRDSSVIVDADLTGSLDMELQYSGPVLDLVAATLFSTWVNTPSKTGNTECTSISGTNTFGVNAGGTAFKANMLVRSTGYTTTGNNGVFRVASSTGTTVVVAGTLTNEASTSNSALKVVGAVAPTNGDIRAAVTPSRLTSEGGIDFTTLGLVPGDWIKIGGSANSGALAFATAANNGWCRIKSIAATSIELDYTQNTWVADTATGKTVQFFFGDRVINGSTRRSFTIEREHADITKFFLFKGLMPASCEFTIQTGQFLRASFNFMGTTETVSGATAAAGTVNPAASEVLNAVNDVQLVRFGSQAAGTLQQFQMRIDNSLRPQKAVGVLGNAGIGIGQFTCGGGLAAYLTDTVLYDQFKNSAEMPMDLVLAKGNSAMVVSMPRIKFESGQINAQGANQDCTLQMQYQALRNASTQSAAEFRRFPYFWVA